MFSVWSADCSNGVEIGVDVKSARAVLASIHILGSIAVVAPSEGVAQLGGVTLVLSIKTLVDIAPRRRP